ncbi:Membrane-associated guanylate kinase, WW and PDZ domain-containing protein 1 [Clonorchis sinensis]|uniref:Membrane-associated guanylate kinase, WW and PDZ domain-containing protein 1 n=1 Tax=Clonorchis sinensis TaxID=79923 RepID=A0A3R7BYF4_CLOSI|nr:Membrane-associated guanylate kinase, WW and PDZ domain-containing protein 1 [Clonorchis sinensis]
MLESNGCSNNYLPFRMPKPGANFVSPLQKAVGYDFKSGGLSPWLDQCYEVLVSSTYPDLSLSLPIDGGSDAGMFCVIGSQLDLTRLTFHKIIPSSSHYKSRQAVNPGDIILAFDNYEISGYTRRDAIELCDKLSRSTNPSNQVDVSRPRLKIRLSPPQALATGSTMLSSFLGAAFPLNSAEYSLQERIRENVYQRVVPCTTRLPRAEEVDGVHYRFMSVPQFLALERSGQLLESGMYNGNHYGTPRPEPSATALDTVLLNQLSLSTSSSVHQADDSCPIPPPLPPLASLTNVVANASTPFATSFPTQHPTPPRPPTRHSSISNQSSKDNLTLSIASNPHALGEKPESSNEGTSDRIESTNLTTRNPRWNQMNGNGSNSYLLDCDIADGHWKNPGGYVGLVTDVPKKDDSQKPSDLWNTLPVSNRPLPYGWEVVRDQKYGTFYIDHLHERTQYESPTEEDYALAEAIKANHSASFNSAELQTSTATGVPFTSVCTARHPQRSSAAATPHSDNHRVPPTVFTTDPNQLPGPLFTASLVKSPRGFGFTIVGGTDCSRPGFLQIKHLIPGGPAFLNGNLNVGDTLVTVNSINVLGFTHSELVALFQSIPVGSTIQLVVSQAFCLADELCASPIVNGPVKVTESFAVNGMDVPATVSVHMNTSLEGSVRSGSSQTSNTASPQLSISPSSSTTATKPYYESPPTSTVAAAQSPRVRVQRPEFLKVAIFKQPNGFGFTLADHPQGQHVKAILDPARCGCLKVGDVIVEINDQRVKEVPHAEVVQLLKQCPVGQEARLLIQRGGLYTSPLSLVTTDRDVSGLSIMDSKTDSDVIDLRTSRSLHPESEPSVKPIYGVPQTRSRTSNHLRTVSGGLVDLSQSSEESSQKTRSQTPDPQMGKQFNCDQVTYMELAYPRTSSHMLKPSLTGSDGVHRIQPSDDSVLEMEKSAAVTGSPDSPTQYGSLLRLGKMNRIRQSNVPISRNGQFPGQSCGALRTSFIMLPGEFFVHLQRQSTGFGFNIVGGAEENSQVVVGSLVLGGAAQLSGIVRTGDKIVSVNGTRVVGAKHREVVQMLEQAAHTVGQVTLGLQRSTEPSVNGEHMYSSGDDCDAVEVVVPRSHKDDGFGFFVSNTRPREFSHEKAGATPSCTTKVDGEYIAQLVPGSKAERLGLLSVGDQILAVNRVPIFGLHHEQVVRLIRESGSHIVLTIIPSPASSWATKSCTRSNLGTHPLEFPVTLFRGGNGFGFSIRGGQEFNRMPLVVLRIADGGAAKMDGRLQVGDELVQINGCSTIGMSHGRAIEIIQAGGNTMHLVVRRHVSGGKLREPLTAKPHQRQGSYIRGRIGYQASCVNVATSVDKKRNRYSIPTANFASKFHVSSCKAPMNKTQTPNLSGLNWMMGLARKHLVDKAHLVNS